MLDSGPFEELPCRLLREAGYTLHTFDGSPYAVNYRGSRADLRRGGEVQDVELLPAHYQDEDGEILEAFEGVIQTVYVIVFEEDEDEARVCGKLSGKLSGKLFKLSDLLLLLLLLLLFYRPLSPSRSPRRTSTTTSPRRTT
jgi:hypothetical protein